MTLPNDEFASCELSREELETVAAGAFFVSTLAKALYEANRTICGNLIRGMAT